jgi:hypothetical protein
MRRDTPQLDSTVLFSITNNSKAFSKFTVEEPIPEKSVSKFDKQDL